MITNILFFVLAAVVVVALAVYVRLRTRAKGAVFPWLGPQAGIDPVLWTPVYWVAKLFFALVPGISILFTTDGAEGAASAIVATVGGFFVPDVFLLARRRIRQRSIERALSFFLDLMVSLLRAGLPVEEAFTRAGLRGLPLSHPLGVEVARTASDLSAGVDRARAYRGLADRTGVSEVRPMTSAMELGSRLGFGIADILGAQADVLRDRRLELGRQRIDRAMIGALVPVMLCGLPLLLVVVVLPIAVDIGRTLEIMRALF